jgi:ADP-ribose pyrophosphatase
MVNKWKIINRELVFKKYSRAIEKVDVQMPNGENTSYYIKKESPAAAILALTKDQKIIIVRQFRIGPNMILDELPGGYVDDGENGINAIKRELLEETGYSGDVEYVGACLDDAYSTMIRHAFVAKNCIKIAEPSPNKHEEFEVKLIDLKTFDQLILSGNMTDIEIAYICLRYLGLLGKMLES